MNMPPTRVRIVVHYTRRERARMAAAKKVGEVRTIAAGARQRLRLWLVALWDRLVRALKRLTRRLRK